MSDTHPLNDWRSKLEAFERLADERSLDKERLWDNLQRRLQQKNAARKKIYWIAASLFIFFTAGISFTANNIRYSLELKGLVKTIPHKKIKTTDTHTVNIKTIKHRPDLKFITDKNDSLKINEIVKRSPDTIVSITHHEPPLKNVKLPKSVTSFQGPKFNQIPRKLKKNSRVVPDSTHADTIPH